MLLETFDILRKGDDSGNGMLVRFRLPSGMRVFGLPTENFYGGHWDLGPTWNFVVMADPPFLVDAGRRGQGNRLVAMMETAGIRPADLDFVLISHGHEDHDGGVAGLAAQTGLKIRAHRIYERLIRRYPLVGPKGDKQRFPAKCWHCFMPESFFRAHCMEYHQELQGLEVDAIGDGRTDLAKGLWAYHLPGHSPDCLAVRIGDEAILVGDIILPDISPWPTRKALFGEVAPVIGPEYQDPEAVFGLERYLKSLYRLQELDRRHPGLRVLPAHRLFAKGRWNGIELAARAAELLEHHVQRCGAFMDILADGPKSVGEIAGSYFSPDLLKGLGRIMAANEVDSHCELLLKCGDVIDLGDRRYASNNSFHFEAYIAALSLVENS